MKYAFIMLVVLSGCANKQRVTIDECAGIRCCKGVKCLELPAYIPEYTLE